MQLNIIRYYTNNIAAEIHICEWCKPMNRYAIGVDLGGSKISGALVDHVGAIAFKESLPTHAEEPVASVMDRIVYCIEKFQSLAHGAILGIGIGVAAMTDSQRGVVIHASNLLWTNVPLRDLIIERMGIKWNECIWVDKDTNAAALGEMHYGAGRSSRHLLYVTVGTGVGGGMILDGRVYHGASEGASDLGHLVLNPQGETCGCGKRGCLETLSSGRAIARQAQEALRRGNESALSDMNIEEITAYEVVEAAKKGDTLAKNILTSAGRFLGIALAYYVDLNNPELIIIGGGVSAAGDLLIEPIRQTIKELSLPANFRTVKVVPAGLGADSGSIGAASLVWDNLERLPVKVGKE
jgi:glucokinase